MSVHWKMYEYIFSTSSFWISLQYLYIYHYISLNFIGKESVIISLLKLCMNTSIWKYAGLARLFYSQPTVNKTECFCYIILGHRPDCPIVLFLRCIGLRIHRAIRLEEGCSTIAMKNGWRRNISDKECSTSRIMNVHLINF